MTRRPPWPDDDPRAEAWLQGFQKGYDEGDTDGFDRGYMQGARIYSEIVFEQIDPTDDQGEAA